MHVKTSCLWEIGKVKIVRKILIRYKWMQTQIGILFPMVELNFNVFYSKK